MGVQSIHFNQKIIFFSNFLVDLNATTADNTNATTMGPNPTTTGPILTSTTGHQTRRPPTPGPFIQILDLINQILGKIIDLIVFIHNLF
jgi:hypothetical protein